MDNTIEFSKYQCFQSFGLPNIVSQTRSQLEGRVLLRVYSIDVDCDYYWIIATIISMWMINLESISTKKINNFICPIMYFYIPCCMMWISRQIGVRFRFSERSDKYRPREILETVHLHIHIRHYISDGCCSERMTTL